MTTHRNTNASAWQSSASSLSTTINYTAGKSNRKAIACAVSRTGYPANTPAYNGAAMAPVDGASINARGWYLCAYELAGFDTGNRTISLSLGGTHSNCCLFVIAADTDSATPIYVRDVGLGDGASAMPTLVALLDSADADLLVGFGAVVDTELDGEAYTVQGGSLTLRTARGDSSDYAAASGTAAGSDGEVAAFLGIQNTNVSDWAMLAVSLADSEAGGPAAELEGDAAAQAGATGQMEAQAAALEGAAAGQASAAGALAADVPAGTVTFDCAVGTVGVATRGVDYDGADAASPGFRLQWDYSLDGGSTWAGWQDTGVDAARMLMDTPAALGGAWAPGSVITLKLRAANDAGAGAASGPKKFRLHQVWHRPGVALFAPNATTGHAAAGYDVTPQETLSGPLSTGGTDRLVLAFQDTAYGRPEASPDTYIHDFLYDDALATKVLSYYCPSGRRGAYAGGTELFFLADPPTGQHTARFEWVSPTIERSTWIAVWAVQRAHQADPIASTKARLLPAASLYPGIDDESQYDEAYDFFDDSSYQSLHVRDVPASYDELILSCNGTYGQTSVSGGGSDANEFGEAGVAGANWGSHTGSPPRNTAHLPYDTHLVPFVGCGAGAEDTVRVAAYDVGQVPATMPLHRQWWHESVNQGWGAIVGVAIRPSPNMIHTLSAPLARTTGVTWQCYSECNHGRVLVAITAQSDPEPTALQIQQHLETGSSGYAGTFLLLDAREMAEGEVAATGGTVSDSTGAVAAGARRLSAAYEPQQGFLGGTGDLGASIHLDIDVQEPIELAGGAVTITLGGASFTTEVRMIGAAGGVVTADGVLSTQTRFSGAALAQALAATLMTTGIPVIGAAQGLAAAGAAITLQIRMAGGAVVAAVVTGDLTAGGTGMSGGAQSSAFGAAALSTGIPVVGAALVVASVDGTLISPTPLEGVAASVTAGLGSLDTAITLQGEALTQVLGGGDFTVYVRFAAGALALAAAGGILAGSIYAPTPERTWDIEGEERVWE